MNVLLPLLLTVAVPQQETDTSLLQYEVNGIHVIHQRRSPATDVIAVRLYLLGGSRNVTAEQAGIERVLLEVATYGSERYPGEESRRALARTGSMLTSSTGYDWSIYGFDGLKQDFDSTWAVVTDRLIRPSFDSASFEVVRQRLLGSVARRRNSPESYAAFLADSVAFAGHPYSSPAGGTEGSLKAMTIAAVRDYHKQQLVGTRMLLVIVGDLTRAKVEPMIAATLGTLPRGAYKWTLPAPIVPTKQSLVVAQRAVRTNYIVATAFGPSRGSPEFDAFEWGMGQLGGMLSFQIRERAKLSYAAGISVYDMGVPHAQFSVSTTNPDSVMKLVTYWRDYLTSDSVTMPRAWLRDNAETATLSWTAATETASGQVGGLARAFLLQGDPRLAARGADIAKRMTFHDMRRAVRTHGRCYQYVFVGDTTAVPREAMLGKDPKC